MATSLLPSLNSALCDWLSLEDGQIELTQANWALPTADAIPDIIMTSRGSRRSRRIAVALTAPLVEMAARDVLQLDSGIDPAALAVLRPFAEQNMLSLGDHMKETRIMMHSGLTDPIWTVDQRSTVLSDFSAFEVLSMEVAFLDGDGGDMRIVLIITTELLAIGQSEDDVAPPPPKAPRLPPRLGPCHVEIQAVADRVRMSVADCSRLKIGQVISLPGLRFDHLELSVEMGDGPVPLTDASLGADKGLKAVRLNRGLDPSFRVAPEALQPASKAEAVPA
jgi:hypothetical protein